jgi:hypothetical protein
VATVQDTVRSTLTELHANADILAGVTWLSERFAELVQGTRLTALRRSGSLVVPAALQTGTVTLTRGSDLVTGDSDAQTAWAAVQTALVGRWFQTRTAWYEIAEVTGTSAPALRLRSVFAEDDVSATAYTIVQRYAALDPEARSLGQFVLPRWRLPISVCSPFVLDRAAPDRRALYIGPRYVAEVSEGLDATKQVELWPYSTTTELVTYTFWKKPPAFDLDDPIPGVIDSGDLKQGLLINVMRHKQAMAADAGEMERAAFWRNEARAQETRWEMVKRRAREADSGVDDIGFLLSTSTYGPYGSPDHDIKTAYQDWVSRGGL